MIYDRFRVQHEWKVVGEAVRLTYDFLNDSQDVYTHLFAADTRRENLTYLRGAKTWVAAKKKENQMLENIILPLGDDSFGLFRRRYFMGMYPSFAEQMVLRVMHPRSVPFSFTSRVVHERFEMEMNVWENLYQLDVAGSGRYDSRAQDLLHIVTNYFLQRPLKRDGKEVKSGVVVDLLK